MLGEKEKLNELEKHFVGEWRLWSDVRHRTVRDSNKEVRKVLLGAEEVAWSLVSQV